MLDGRTEPRFAQLDEAMLPVLAGRMSPEWAGEVYCTVINVCHEVAGAALYQLGEIRRLRGEVLGAREAYAQARELGTEPQPGEALLQHATGHGDVAWAQLGAALAGGDRFSRARLLAAGVEVACPSDESRRPTSCAGSWRRRRRHSQPRVCSRGPRRRVSPSSSNRTATRQPSPRSGTAGEPPTALAA